MTKRLILLLAALAPLVPYSQTRIEGGLGAPSVQEQVLYLWSGGHVKKLFPGFESLAADLYWLRTVQYFGSERRFAREKRFELLRPLIEITTDLDPRLEVAYRYGAIVPRRARPRGRGAAAGGGRGPGEGRPQQPARLAAAAGAWVLPLHLPARP